MICKSETSSEVKQRSCIRVHQCTRYIDPTIIMINILHPMLLLFLLSPFLYPASVSLFSVFFFSFISSESPKTHFMHAINGILVVLHTIYGVMLTKKEKEREKEHVTIGRQRRRRSKNPLSTQIMIEDDGLALL